MSQRASNQSGVQSNQLRSPEKSKEMSPITDSSLISLLVLAQRNGIGPIRLLNSQSLDRNARFQFTRPFPLFMSYLLLFFNGRYFYYLYFLQNTIVLNRTLSSFVKIRIDSNYIFTFTGLTLIVTLKFPIVSHLIQHIVTRDHGVCNCVEISGISNRNFLL